MYAKPCHQRVQQRGVLALRTIGYQGASLAEFVGSLQSAGVSLKLYRDMRGWGLRVTIAGSAIRRTDRPRM
jgi:hypothetical protein